MTGRSIEGPTEETIDFLRVEGVDITDDGNGKAEGGEEERGKRRGGGGRESDQNGFKGCYTQWHFYETGSNQTDAAELISNSEENK